MPPKKLPPKAQPASAQPAKAPPAKTPPAKLPPKATQQKAEPKPQSKPQPKPQQKQPAKPSNQRASAEKSNGASAPSQSQPAIPEREVKQSSATSAQLALEATKKAYDLRQAAYGAADPNAREEILAKAINKEIEAESFGKAAKYTRSGAFQGLAAGAGLGVQPGVTLGKLTGAIVGGLVSSVGALLGGGAGSVYGAISGPFWDLGEMASQGVRSIVGDFPNWQATDSQKKALDKMVLGASQTETPSRGELEQMRNDNGGGSMDDYQQFAQDLKSWIPSMPTMPQVSMPEMPSGESMPSVSTLSNTLTSMTGLGGAPQAQRGAPTNAAPNQNRQVPASGRPQQPPKPAERFTDRHAEAQRPKAANEAAAKNRPKKLETRSNSGNVSQPNTQAPPRKVAPKLEPRRSAVATK